MNLFISSILFNNLPKHARTGQTVKCVGGRVAGPVVAVPIRQLVPCNERRLVLPVILTILGVGHNPSLVRRDDQQRGIDFFQLVPCAGDGDLQPPNADGDYTRQNAAKYYLPKDREFIGLFHACCDVARKK